MGFLIIDQPPLNREVFFMVQRDIEYDENRIAALTMIEEWIRQLEIDDENDDFTNNEFHSKPITK
jgi:hypothetical protein